MTISSILRNFNGDPNLVSIVTDNSYEEITAPGYLVLPEIKNSIAEENGGYFEFKDTDFFVINYDASTTELFLRDASQNTFTPMISGDIAPNTVTAAMLVTATRPTAVVKFNAQVTTTNNATNILAVSGANPATCQAFVQMVNNGTNNVTCLRAVITTDTISVTFSGAPGTDAVFNVMMIENV